MSQDEKLTLEKCTNPLFEQAWLLMIYLLLGGEKMKFVELHINIPFV